MIWREYVGNFSPFFLHNKLSNSNCPLYTTPVNYFSLIMNI